MEIETEIPKMKIRKVSFRMTKPDFKEFELTAKKNKLNKSAYLRTILKKQVDHDSNNSD